MVTENSITIHIPLTEALFYSARLKSLPSLCKSGPGETEAFVKQEKAKSKIIHKTCIMVTAVLLKQAPCQPFFLNRLFMEFQIEPFFSSGSSWFHPIITSLTHAAKLGWHVSMSSRFSYKKFNW